MSPPNRLQAVQGVLHKKGHSSPILGLHWQFLRHRIPTVAPNCISLNSEGQISTSEEDADAHEFSALDLRSAVSVERFSAEPAGSIGPRRGNRLLVRIHDDRRHRRAL